MLLILTGTICPSSKTGFLELRDEAERLKQYEESICFFIESGAFSKIIFCENSNYGTDRLSYLQEKAKENQVQLELLSFCGDTEQVNVHGKGFGEGEIMQYVFENSRLLSGERTFVKITGRMKVNNIADIVCRLKENNCYFNIPNRTHREMYDTRIYAMPTEVFKQHFMEKYTEVMDEEGWYLEKVYTAVLKQKKLPVKNFPKYPRIIGMSASTGYSYVYTEWKCKVKDVLSLFQFYKVNGEIR